MNKCAHMGVMAKLSFKGNYFKGKSHKTKKQEPSRTRDFQTIAIRFQTRNAPQTNEM